MFKFPKFEPDINIVDLPGEDFEVVCRDMGSGFVLLELGAENEFAFYDYPKEEPKDGRLVLSGAHQLKVVRRIRLDDFQMFEIESRYAEAGADYTDPPSTWNHIISESGLRSIAEIEAPGRDKWTFKAESETPFPTIFRVGLRASGREPYYTTGQEPDRVCNWILEVPTAAQVSIGSKIYRCIKVVWGSDNPDDDRPSACEYYVADSGRTVYFRRYNGPKYPNYEELTGNPTMEFMGTVWRHWYDCIPDHALITDVY